MNTPRAFEQFALGFLDLNIREMPSLPPPPEILIERALKPLKPEQRRSLHEYLGALLSSDVDDKALRAHWLNSGAEYIVAIHGQFRPFLALAHEMTAAAARGAHPPRA